MTWFKKDITRISWSVSKKRHIYPTNLIGYFNWSSRYLQASLQPFFADGKGRHFEDVLKILYRIIYKLVLIAICLLELSTNWTPSLVLVSTRFVLVPVLRKNERNRRHIWCGYLHFVFDAANKNLQRLCTQNCGGRSANFKPADTCAVI